MPYGFFSERPDVKDKKNSKQKIRMDSGCVRVARSSCGAKAPPLAARPSGVTHTRNLHTQLTHTTHATHLQNSRAHLNNTTTWWILVHHHRQQPRRAEQEVDEEELKALQDDAGATWLIDTCDMSHYYVWHGSSICVTRLILVCHDSIIGRVGGSQGWCRCDMTHSHVWHDLSICVTWLIHMCDMIHLYAWRTHPYVRLIHMSDMTHSCMWYDASISVPWFMYMCDGTHQYVWHDSSIYMTWLMHMCDVTHWHEALNTDHLCDMTHLYVCISHAQVCDTCVL